MYIQCNKTKGLRVGTNEHPGSRVTPCSSNKHGNSDQKCVHGVKLMRTISLKHLSFCNMIEIIPRGTASEMH